MIRTPLRCPARSRPVPAAALAAILTLTSANAASAHGAGHTVVDRPVDGCAMTMEFSLSSGQPLAGARFTVFGPGDDATFQEGRSDRLGRVAFLPDRVGRWRLEVTDDDGHAAAASFEVGSERATPAPPLWRRWLLRLSLIANVIVVVLLIQATPRRRRLGGGALEPQREG